MKAKLTIDGVEKDVEIVFDPHQILTFRRRLDTGTVVVKCAGPHGLDEGTVEITGSDRYDGEYDLTLGDGTPGLGPDEFLIPGPYTFDGFGGRWQPTGG